MKKLISVLLVLSMIASMFVTVSAVEIEVPGSYVTEEETETSTNAVTADMTGGYQPITLSVPFYCQRRASDCGISSIAMVEAYKKGYGSNDITAYNAVYNYNDSSVFLASYGKLGYETIANDLSEIYTQLKHDNPVIVYRTGNQKDHYSVIYGYNGSTSSLEKKGFLVLNTWHNSSYSVVEPGTIGYTDLETWLSGATWIHTMIRTGNNIPLSDKNNGAGGFNQVWVSGIEYTNAYINAKIPYQWITACGFYIGTSTSNMTKIVDSEVDESGAEAAVMWFELNKYYKTLSKDTCYYYKVYYVSNGVTYTSKTYSFYTGYATEGCEPVVPETVIVNVTATEGGTVEGAGEYELGANVTLTATADAGYNFVGWFDGETQVSAEATYTFVPAADNNLEARFEVIEVPGEDLETETSGVCGENLTWTLDLITGVLTISGSGDMYSYTYPDNAPWYSNVDSIKTVVINEGVTSIGDEAFRGCSNLTSINIPDGITWIGNWAFYECYSLIGVYITDISSWCGIDFDDPYSNPLYSGADLYLNNSLVTDLIIPDSVTSIGDYAFYYCSSLTSIVILDSVTSIGYFAFSGCSSLTSITIPDSVTDIYDRAFDGCSSLTSVNIPGSVTWIGGWAFSGCSSLTSVTIPDSVTSIGYNAFYGCNALITVYYQGTQSDWDKITIGEGNEDLTNAEIIFADHDTPAEPEVPADSPQLIMGSLETLAGKEVVVTLLIKNNPGIAGLLVSLGYDESVLTLKDTKRGDLFSGFSAAKNFAWDESYDVVEDGILATFTFAVAEDAEVGDYSIEVIIRSCTNENLDDVELTSVNGTISVIDFVYGDANGDAQIDMKDVVIMRKYITNFDYDTNTSPVNVGYGADANGDGLIDMKDVVILRKYITNYDYDTESSTVVLGPQQ